MLWRTATTEVLRLEVKIALVHHRALRPPRRKVEFSRCKFSVLQIIRKFPYLKIEKEEEERVKMLFVTSLSADCGRSNSKTRNIYFTLMNINFFKEL